jgi:hypothetical protein
VVGDALANALVGPILIEVSRIFGDHPLQMLVIVDENMVQTLSP